MHPENPATNTAEWTWNPFHFRFTCDDETVRRRVADVMARWGCFVNPNADRDDRIDLHQRATQDDAGHWIFTGSQPEARGQCSSITDITRAVEADATLAVLNHPGHFLTVHGALVARGGAAVLVIGPSMSGKSTLACQLWLDGWQLMGDDVTLLVQDDDDQLCGVALPRRVSLRSSTRPLLPADKWEELQGSATCDTTDEGIVFHPAAAHRPLPCLPLRAVVFLKNAHDDHTAPLLSPVHAADAVMAACAYTNIVKQSGMGKCLSKLTPLLTPVPAFHLARAEVGLMSKAITELHDKLAAAP